MEPCSHGSGARIRPSAPSALPSGAGIELVNINSLFMTRSRLERPSIPMPLAPGMGEAFALGDLDVAKDILYVIALTLCRLKFLLSGEK